MLSKRDDIVAAVANWFINTFASEEYVMSFEKVIDVGMRTLDAAVIQQEKTPTEPFAVQVGFNGYTPISTLTKSFKGTST